MPWARMFLLAHTRMGFTEPEFWRLTLRKYVAIRDEIIESEKPPEEQDAWADDVF